MLTLYDAARCPYCARVRILLAEKNAYETFEIDLENRPVWLYEKTRSERCPSSRRTTSPCRSRA